MAVAIDDSMLSVMQRGGSRQHRSLHGLTRALLNNMVAGVQAAGYNKILLMKASVTAPRSAGKRLVLFVGYSHPVYFEPDQEISPRRRSTARR